MGFGMPEHLARTAALRAFDKFLNDPDKGDDNAVKLLDKLHSVPSEQYKDLADVLADPDILIIRPDRPLRPEIVAQLSPHAKAQAEQCQVLNTAADGSVTFDQIKHLKQEWFESKQADNDTCHWWNADSGPVKEILLQAWIQVIELRQKKKLKVDSYWLCAGSNNNPFHDPASPGVRCYVAWSPQQITFIVLTPEESFDPPDVSHHASQEPPAELVVSVNDATNNSSGTLSIGPVQPSKDARGVYEAPTQVTVRAYDLPNGGNAPAQA